MANAPSGDLYGLVEMPPAALFPSIVRLEPDGTWDGSNLLLNGPLLSVYSAIVFKEESIVLALNRSSDSIDAIDIVTGLIAPIVTALAARVSTATSAVRSRSTMGFVELDVRVTVEENETSGSIVRLDPRRPAADRSAGGVDAALRLRVHRGRQPRELAGDRPPGSARGVRGHELHDGRASCRRHRMAASSASTTCSSRISSDTAFQDPDPESVNPPGGVGRVRGRRPDHGPAAGFGRCRRGGGAGRFRPGRERRLPARHRVSEVQGRRLFPEPCVPADHPDANNSNMRTVFLNTDAQTLPLPDGSTPGLNEPDHDLRWAVRVPGLHHPRRGSASGAWEQPAGDHGHPAARDPRRARPLGRQRSGRRHVRYRLLAGPRRCGRPRRRSWWRESAPGLQSRSAPRVRISTQRRRRVSRATARCPAARSPHKCPACPAPAASLTFQGGLFEPVGGRGGLCTAGYQPINAPTNLCPGRFRRPTTTSGTGRPVGVVAASTRPASPAHEGSGSYKVESLSALFPTPRAVRQLSDQRQDQRRGVRQRRGDPLRNASAQLECSHPVRLPGRGHRQARRRAGAPGVHERRDDVLRRRPLQRLHRARR